VEAATTLNTVMRLVNPKAPGSPIFWTMEDTLKPASADVMEVNPLMGANHCAACRGVKTELIKDQY
jgi:hypothetical protein